MGRVILVLALVACLLLGCVLLMREFSPEVKAIRAARIAADEVHVETLSDAWAMTKLTCLGSVSLLMAGCAIALVYGAFLRVRRVYPVWNALYPQLPQSQSNVTALNEAGAQRIAAFSYWRGRMSQANWEKMVNGPDAALIGDDVIDVPQLPAVSPSVYSAALPSELSMGFGVDAYGNVASWPLEDMGGVVVGGLTRMGKSDLLAALLVYLARQAGDGSRLQFAIADLKDGIDFSGIPDELRLMAHPVVYDADGANTLINTMVAEMHRRGDLLRQSGHKHITTYNRATTEPLPYQVLVIDELGALMTGKAIPRETEDALVGFANRAGAVGMSGIFATQRPAGDTIPVKLRDACGTRVALPCATKYHSMAILDSTGAELLPREPGNALIWHGDMPQPIKPFFSDLKGGKADTFFRSLPRRLALPGATGGVTAGATGATGGVTYQSATATVALPEVLSHSESALLGANRDLVALARQALPETIDDARQLTAEQRRYIWALFQRTQRESNLYSISAVQAILWPKLVRGGRKFEVLDVAIRQEAERRRLAVVPIQGRGVRLEARR